MRRPPWYIYESKGTIETNGPQANINNNNNNNNNNNVMWKELGINNVRALKE